MTEYDKKMKDFAESTIKTFEKFNRQLRLHANELTKALRKGVEEASVYTDNLPEGKMTEYDEKVKELNELIDWFDEHGGAKENEDDVFVIICPSDNDEKMHTYVSGYTSLVRGYLINILNDVEMETWE